MTLPRLDLVEQRILGSLLEKQRTVPASYPLSATALRTACNQSSSREPVLDLDQEVVESVCRTLKSRGLLRIVWSDSGRRTLKYHQILDETLGLGAPEAALLAVLMLRGPQAPGELRARTERLHAFADRESVERALRELAARDEPLVVELARRPGQHDPRWAHLLGDVPTPDDPPAAAPGSGVDVAESVLRAGAHERDDRVRVSYETVAESYAAAFADELAGLPFERWLLDRVVSHALEDGAPVVEVGTGPGHVAAYLAAGGTATTGLDLSPAMVEQARGRFPDVDFEIGDLRRLMRPTTHDGWSAVLAWYALVHLAPSELPEAVAALARPLRPGGLLVLALHTGAVTEVRHADRWFDGEIDLDFVLHERAEVVSAVEAAGLTDLEWYHRGPAASRDEETERLYVLARLPDSEVGPA